MRAIEELLLRLVAVRSDTGTAMECDMAATILELIREDPYFQANPQLCGAYDAGDLFGRPVIWALKQGSGKQTLVLSGHYDVVETTCYGELRELALRPLELKAAMLAKGGYSPAGSPRPGEPGLDVWAGYGRHEGRPSHQPAHAA